MTLNQLRQIVAIVDANHNISLAAKVLNATQPAMSRQLKLIEEELGFQVFIRRGKSLDRLTRSGEELVKRARAVLGEVRNIDALAANHRQESRGQLRVATTQALGRYVLPPALARLRDKFGSVQVQLRPADGGNSLELLDRDEIDLSLVNTEGETPGGDIVIPLFRWNRALIAPSTHPLASRDRKLSLHELAEYPLIAAENIMRDDSKLGRAFHSQGLVPNVACTARDADTIKTFVRLGLGIGFVAEMALTPEDSDLVELGGADLFPTCVTWAVLRGDRVQRDYVLELLSELSPSLPRSLILSLLGGASVDRTAGRIEAWDEIRRTDEIAVSGG